MVQIMRFNPTATVIQFDGTPDSFEAVSEALSKIGARVTSMNGALQVVHGASSANFRVVKGQWVCVFMNAVTLMEDAQVNAAMGIV